MAQVAAFMKDYEWTQISPDAATPFRSFNKSEQTILVLYSVAQPPARGSGAAYGAAIDAAIPLEANEWFGRTSEAPAAILWGLIQQQINSSIETKTVIVTYSL